MGAGNGFMTQSTAEESKKRYVEVMGDDLGNQYAALWQEVVYLHRKWTEYLVLFGTKRTRIPILNKAAPTFFRMVQDVFWDDTLLHIARLTDAPKSGTNKTNLTLRNLPALTKDDGLKARLEPLVTKVLEQSEFCRDWRNKVVAHRDLEVALNEKAEPLQGGSRDQVNEVLETIAAIMNAVSGHYLEPTTIFRFGESAGGALPLLYVLKDGINLETERLERVLGEGRESDHVRENL